jgi:succinate-semialdehyde dehydrogenase/glutarate-semialdehyde dehydrogenase
MTIADNLHLRKAAFIDGQWISAENTFSVYNPATEELIGCVPNLGNTETLKAIDSAEKAFLSWSETSECQRASVICEWADAIRGHVDALAQLTTCEQGRPLAEAKQEWLSGAETLEWLAAEAQRIHGKTFPYQKDQPLKYTQMEPLGVVAAITPWNFSALSVLVKCGAAIAAGCTVVLKPSEYTPFGALAVAAMAERAQLPPGVLNIVTTDKAEPVGQVLCEDQRVKVLTFTGSTSVGKQLSAQAAMTVKHVDLELGGNSPFIVLPDADLALAAKDLLGARFFNNGQICVGANRVYVHEEIAAAFLDEFMALTQKLVVGDGLAPNTDCGPLICASARDKVSYLIGDALEKGAKLELGGKPLPQVGYFFPPTVLTRVTQEMAIRQAEIFGPVAAISTFASLEAVITEANNTPAGLAAYCYTSSSEQQRLMVRKLRAGMVGCNTTNLFDHRMGFGGRDQSGHGREGGIDALKPYLNEKNVFLQ